jgi:hypothetical protein
MGYIVLISCLLVFSPARFKGLRAKRPAGPAKAASAQPAPAEKPVNLLTVSESDKTYMHVYLYQQETAPIFAAVSEIDSMLRQPDLRLDSFQVQNLIQKLSDLSTKADTLQAPAGLGPCGPAVKSSVEQLKSAVAAAWNYQTTHSADSQSSFQQGLSVSKNQKNYCEGIEDVLIKQLEPGLSHSKAALQKAAPTFFQPPPAPPPPSPEQPAPGSSVAPQPQAQTQPEAPPLAQPQPNAPDRQVNGPFGMRRDRQQGRHGPGHDRYQNQVQQNPGSQPQDQGVEPQAPGPEQGSSQGPAEDTGEPPADN